ncbi:hemagglutinin repeat-containing protein [Propionispora sp. 2/2-37]|uniref:hemagglutinin repeat-containing protein n=1 Tax=Propionispora sp. 2/2-37 TaxID=1677858 RepID=UPI0012E2124B|nr:hemagglutinin repeat-containing protein [Propionispora sp. 2/2-37]
MHYDETTIGTNLAASQDISLKAAGDITLAGSSAVSEQGTVSVDAGKDIAIRE